MLPPKTPDDMFSLVTHAMMVRLYGELALEARRKRLTEHDISLIETRIIRILREGEDFSGEVKGYESEPVMADIEAYLKGICRKMCESRAAHIGKK